MALQDEITHNYRNRINKENLYNSTYAELSDLEKQKKLKHLVNQFIIITKNTTILEVGAGQGGNLSMLFNLGFNSENIFVNELLPERIAALKRNYPKIKIIEGDALKANFEQQFDVVFQSTVFTSILNDDNRLTLAKKMWDVLKPSGIILWYDFIYNNPKNINVKKVDIKTVKKLFPYSIKTKIIKTTLAPPIGRRVGKLYNLFNLSFLRSHILVVFQKP